MKLNKLKLSLKARRIVAALGLSGLGMLAILGGEAQAAAVLTVAGTTQGFGLSTFVSSIPSNGVVGPVGIVNTTGGDIMISGYASGQVRVFSDTDGQAWMSGIAAATPYGFNNVAGLATLGGNFYAAEQASGKVVQIDAAGNYLSNIANIGFATSIIGNAATNRLYVGNTVNIFEINPTNNTFSVFANAGADGLTLSADGSMLYTADIHTGHLLGFNTATKSLAFDSGYIGGGIDGAALGSGSLLGEIFVNTNSGTLIDVNLLTKSQTVIVAGGSRGDFVWVDSNTGTLLFTQTDSVLRLTAPSGGSFGSVSAVPEPETYAMLLAGLGLLGFMARRRKNFERVAIGLIRHPMRIVTRGTLYGRGCCAIRSPLSGAIDANISLVHFARNSATLKTFRDYSMYQTFFKQTATVLLLICGVAFNSASALATTTVIDFSGGLPAGGTASGGTVVVDGYQFSSITSSVSVPWMGNHFGINWGYGLTAGTTGAYPNTTYVPFSISRVDGQSFNLEGVTSFVGGTLSGGPTSFEITAFDMSGNELVPTAFDAGQFWTTYTKTMTAGGLDQFTGISSFIHSTASGSFSNLSMLKFSSGLTDHFTKFSFSSATPVVTPPLPPAVPVPVTPVPEPETYAMLLAGLGMIGFVARRRKNFAA